MIYFIMIKFEPKINTLEFWFSITHILSAFTES
jgi:hypothetical protein